MSLNRGNSGDPKKGGRTLDVAWCCEDSWGKKNIVKRAIGKAIQTPSSKHNTDPQPSTKCSHVPKSKKEPFSNHVSCLSGVQEGSMPKKLGRPSTALMHLSCRYPSP